MPKDYQRFAIPGLSERIDAFHQALGAFVSAFSNVESTIQTVLWHVAGVPSPTAQAVFTGIRANEAMSLITRISGAQKWRSEKKKEIANVFGQFGQINRLRNYGAYLAGPEQWRVSNELFAHIPKRVQKTIVTVDILKDASADLHKIDSHLIMLAWRKAAPPESRRAFRETMRSAWRYKPPQQGQKRKKSQKTRRARRLRRQPSQG